MKNNIIIFIIAIILMFAAPCFFAIGFYFFKKIPQNLDKTDNKSFKQFKVGVLWYICSVISLVLGVTLIVILLKFLKGFNIIAFCFKPVATILVTNYAFVALTLLQISEKQEPNTTKSDFSVRYSKYYYVVGLIGNIVAVAIAYLLIFDEGMNKSYGWILVVSLVILSSFLIYIYKRKKLIVYYGQFKNQHLFGKTEEFLLSNIQQAEIKAKHGEPFIYAYDRNHKKLFEISYNEMKNSEILIEYLHRNDVKMIDMRKVEA